MQAGTDPANHRQNDDSDGDADALKREQRQVRAGADPANHRQHAHAAAAPRHRRALCGAAREWQRGGSNCGREAGVATDFIPNTQVPTAETDYVARCEAADTRHIVQQHQLRTQRGRLPVAKRPTRDILANIDSCETRNANCNSTTAAFARGGADPEHHQQPRR